MADEPVLKRKAVQVDIKSGLDFESFTVIKVLSNDAKSKKIHVHGRFKDSEDDTIVSFEKTPFSEDSIQNILSSETVTNEVFSNDIYSQHTAMPQPYYNTLTTQVIRPATLHHIKKYTYQKLKVVEETPDSYKKITLPYIMENSMRVEWVYNILDHKSETERIIYEDSDPENGFVLLPDIKWDGKQVENLYVCAIIHNRKIKSIRDLNEKHLPLLKNLLRKGLDEIVKKYGVSSDEIRSYFHYYPSYYHLHVHYNHLQADVGGTSAEKAHLLSDVIDNIENISNDYYQRKTLTVLLREQDPLYSLLSEKV
ncbi:m7GpppX diphosphatase isoform X2 [Hydra vulgaris]|uniref:m7GpppX diphosphatase n=1 Tax=Hydra vulgaris TaxID=6087 RepID=A0ABM4D2C8_HYDVU